MASSYDYGAAIGQAGDLRPIYYRFKRAAQFATSFADILEDSEDATDQYKDFAAGTPLRVTARKSPAGTAIFLDNNTDQAVNFRGLTLEPGEIAPLLRDYKLLPDVTLVSTNVRILGVARQGDTTTLVVYGPNISTGGNVEFPPHIEFRVPENGVSMLKGYGISHGPGNPGRLAIDLFVNKHSIFAVGKEKVRVLAVTEAMADHTWFVEAGGNQYVVGGPAYVGEVEERNGTLHLVAERGVHARAGPYGADYDADVGSTTGGTGQAARADFGSFVYGPQVDALRLDPAPGAAVDPQVPTELPAPALAPWRMRRGDAEAAPNYRTTGWKASVDPLPMGADGDDSAYAWYRATVTAPTAGDYILDFSDAGDWLTVFVNGRPAGSSKVQQRLARPVSRRIPVTLSAGKNTVAVLTAHYGRQKLFNFLGPIGLFDAKGLSGPVNLTGKGGISIDIARWRMSPMKSMEAPPPQLDLSGNAYTDIKTGDDIFHGNRGLALYCVNLEAAPGPHRALHFENVDDNATVYLNGRRLAHHEGWGQPFDVPLDSAWNANGPNQLAVVVENTDGAGGIMGQVTLEAALPNSLGAIHDWQMRGGLGDTTAKPGAWSALTSAQGMGVPAWYRTEFNWTPPAATGLYPILRVSMRDLSRGFVWLNGHNLGRYPEKVPVDGLYLPECWLTPGRNVLLVFDEEGKSPATVHLTVERAASRVMTAHTAVIAEGK
jgi:beta-galactosidase